MKEVKTWVDNEGKNYIFIPASTCSGSVGDYFYYQPTIYCSCGSCTLTGMCEWCPAASPWRRENERSSN